jgi:hypothetical protein
MYSKRKISQTSKIHCHKIQEKKELPAGGAQKAAGGAAKTA